MTDLFDLIGYSPPEIPFEDTEGKFASDDPAYITPPLKQKSDRGNSLNFSSALSPLGKMIAAKDVMGFSCALDDLQQIVIELCYQLNLLIVNDGFQTPKLETLQEDLNTALNEILKTQSVTAAIAPNSGQGSSNFPIGEKSDDVVIAPIEEEIPTKNEHPRPPNSPETLNGGYIEEKQIKKNGKIVGTYLYERYRENGKLKSKYLGKKTGTFARSP